MKTFILVIATIVPALPGFAQEGNTDTSSAVRQLEERWETAISKRDSKTVGELLASDYQGVNVKGEREDKAAVLSRMNKETDLGSAKLTDLRVYAYGPNVIVAIGDSLEEGTGKDGKPFKQLYRFTDTWLLRDGKWQCIAEEGAPVKGAP